MSDITEDTKAEDLIFKDVSFCPGDQQWACHTPVGSITVLDRMTGFGHRDIKSGYRDPSGRLWIASGNFDVRRRGCRTFGEMALAIKDNANTLQGYHPEDEKNA